MDRQRIEGIKYDLDRLTDAELTNIRGHLLDTHARVTGEIAMLEFKLMQRSQNPLPFEDPELGQYAEVADTIIERTEVAQLGNTAIRRAEQ